jgi:phenylalanyl-tRNA synthetase beta chain
LADMSYQEVITYSFIDKKLAALFSPELEAKELLNPMTADMAVMRTSLWPGLISTFLYNQNRQQDRVRIFESGLRFITEDKKLQQQTMLAGLICGNAAPEQWGTRNRAADFFDLKGDIQNLLGLTNSTHEFSFKPAKHPALHPAQTIAIFRDDEFLGVLGALHPGIAQSLKIEGKIFLFELLLAKLETAGVPGYSEVSKFPEIRRDLAILLNQSIPAKEIQDTIRQEAGPLLKDIDIFDVYQGKGIAGGQKSLALALTLQHSSRTLVDEEIGEVVERVIVALKKQFNAELRG